MGFRLPSATAAGALLLSGVAIAGSHGPGPASPYASWREVDRQHLNYREDGGTKIVADIDAVLERRGMAARVRLSLRAQGPQVAGDPGARGVHGHNRHTAGELRDMIKTGQLEIVGRAAGSGGAGTHGTVDVIARGSMPERRLWDDGHIDHLAHTDAVYPLVVELVLGELAGAAPGENYVVEVVARGVPRLRVVVGPTRSSLSGLVGLDRFGAVPMAGAREMTDALTKQRQIKELSR